MKSILTSFLLVVVSVFVQAQIKNLSLTFSGNYTFIGTTSESSAIQSVQVNPSTGYTSTWANYGSIRESFNGRPGFNFGFRGQVNQFHNFFIETGMGINYYRFKRTIEVVSLPGSQVSIFPRGQVDPIGGNFGVIIGGTLIFRDSLDRLMIGGQPGSLPGPDAKVGETTALYLELPVYVGRNFSNGKIQFRVGMMMAVLVRATEYKPSFSMQQSFFYTYKDTSMDGFNNLLLNTSVEFSYRVTKHLDVTTRLLHSLSGIYDEENRPGGKAKLTTVDFGIRYLLKQ